MNLQQELAKDMKLLMEGESRESVWEGMDPVMPGSQNEDFVYGQEAEESVSYKEEEAFYDGDEEEIISNTGELPLQEVPEEEEE